MYRAQLTGSLKLGLGNAHFDHMPLEAAVLRYDGKDVLKLGYIEDEVFGGSRPSISGVVCNEVATSCSKSRTTSSQLSTAAST